MVLGRCGISFIVLAYDPFKFPNRIKENRDFNYALSKVQIRSEYAIGYLKNRFQYLKEFQVKINNCKDMRFASY